MPKYRIKRNIDRTEEYLVDAPNRDEAEELVAMQEVEPHDYETHASEIVSVEETE